MVCTKFLNKYEEITYQKLRSVCESNGARVYPKVRLIDLLRCCGVRAGGDSEHFALMAHLDFLVVTEGNSPLFCVEFDGPCHSDPVQASRDLKKDSLLKEAALPLLRINTRWLNSQYRHYDLLSYFVDVWFLWESFNEAQENGIVPHDEPFDPTFLQVFDAQGRKTKPWPYHLSYEILGKIRWLESRGKVIQRSPNHIVGTDDLGNSRCVAWIFITPQSGIIAKSGMKVQCFPAVDQSEVLVDLCTFDLYESLVSALKGDGGSKSPAELFADVEDFEKRYRFRGCHIGGYTKPLDTVEPPIGGLPRFRGLRQ